MCRVLNSILAVTAVAGLGGAAPESRSPSIEGVWRAVEVRTTGPGARTITGLQPNLSILTRAHYSHMARGRVWQIRRRHLPTSCGKPGARSLPRPVVTKLRVGTS